MILKDKRASLDMALKGNVRTYLQPIVNINNSNIIGWEALTRGPKNTVLETAGRLFGYADRVGKSIELEKICIEKLFKSINKNMILNNKLFINVSSSLFCEKIPIIIKYAEKYNIVLEITEHFKLNMNDITKAADWYRNNGIEVAIDDIMGGHDRIKSVLYIKPEYIKLERDLIANCNKDKSRQVIIDSLYHLGKNLNIKVIAEGVQTKDELNYIKKMGFELCQGFIFCKPFPALSFIPQQNIDILKNIKHQAL